MIQSVSTVYIFVEDQQRAKTFYTEILGMEVRLEMPDSEGGTSSWISVAPPGAATEISLMQINPMWDHYHGIAGKVLAMQFSVKNLAELIRDLKKKGVTVVQEPNSRGWGTDAIIRDSEGNELFLFEAASWS